MKTEPIECLVDDDRAHELMMHSREILRAAEMSEDDSLKIATSGYRMAESLRALAKAWRHDLTVRCLEDTPQGQQALEDIRHAEQLMAYFCDLAEMSLDWETHRGVSALSLARDDDAGAAPGEQVAGEGPEDLHAVVVGEDDPRILGVIFNPGVGGDHGKVGLLRVAKGKAECLVHDERETGRQVDVLSSEKRVRVCLRGHVDVLVTAEEVVTIRRPDGSAALEAWLEGRRVARFEDVRAWGLEEAIVEG